MEYSGEHDESEKREMETAYMRYKRYVQQFWHPETRKFYISDTAIFDERVSDSPQRLSAPRLSSLQPLLSPPPSHLPASLVQFFMPGPDDGDAGAKPDRVGVISHDQAQPPAPPAPQGPPAPAPRQEQAQRPPSPAHTDELNLRSPSPQPGAPRC